MKLWDAQSSHIVLTSTCNTAGTRLQTTEDANKRVIFLPNSPSLPSYDSACNHVFWRSFGTYCTVALFDPRLLTKFVSASRPGWVRRRGGCWGYGRGGQSVVRWDRKASLCIWTSLSLVHCGNWVAVDALHDTEESKTSHWSRSIRVTHNDKATGVRKHVFRFTHQMTAYRLDTTAMIPSH